MKTPFYSLYGLYIFYNGLYNGLYSGLYIETVPRGMLIGFDAGNAHTPTVAYVSRLLLTSLSQPWPYWCLVETGDLAFTACNYSIPRLTEKHPNKTPASITP